MVTLPQNYPRSASQLAPLHSLGSWNPGIWSPSVVICVNILVALLELSFFNVVCNLVQLCFPQSPSTVLCTSGVLDKVKQGCFSDWLLLTQTLFTSTLHLWSSNSPHLEGSPPQALAFLAGQS